MGFRKKTDMLGKKEASNESTRGKKKIFKDLAVKCSRERLKFGNLSACNKYNLILICTLCIF